MSNKECSFCGIENCYHLRPPSKEELKNHYKGELSWVTAGADRTAYNFGNDTKVKILNARIAFLESIVSEAASIEKEFFLDTNSSVAQKDWKSFGEKCRNAITPTLCKCGHAESIHDNSGCRYLAEICECKQPFFREKK